MPLHTFFRETRLLLGVPRNTTSHNEKMLSALGAGISLVVVSGLGIWLHQFYGLNTAGIYMVVASMGASAVLLFAVPHGALSQPWAVIGGHVISALIGVSCYQCFGSGYISSGLGVGLAVGAMYYLRCVHPPGGATALTAIIGGAAINELGYHFVLVPVLMNVTAILVVAVVFNFRFRWRRYPAHLYYREAKPKPEPAASREFELTQEDFSAAIQKHDSFVDITEEGLTELLELAKQHAEMNITHPKEIIAGKFYSNGKLGSLWSVRQVIDDSEEEVPLASKDRVIYKIVAGHQSYATDICTRDEFKKWARFEVVQKDSLWVKAM